MRAYADRFEGDADLWGVVGLLHDFDYERYPEVAASGHPNRGAEILRRRAWTRSYQSNLDARSTGHGSRTGELDGKIAGRGG